MLNLEIKNIGTKKYGVIHISGVHSEDKKHRGKQVRHYTWNFVFKDGTTLNISIPHYFEEIGSRRKFIRELEKNKLRKRSIKINKLKQKML